MNQIQRIYLTDITLSEYQLYSIEHEALQLRIASISEYPVIGEKSVKGMSTYSQWCNLPSFNARHGIKDSYPPTFVYYSKMRILRHALIGLPHVHVDKNSPRWSENIDMEFQPHIDVSSVDHLDQYFHTIICGEAHVGKTLMAKHILDFRALVIGDLHDLIEFNTDEHQGIIFENMDFKDISIFNLCLLTVQQDRILVIDGIGVFIPRDTHLIFTTRDLGGDIFPNNKVIESRCERVWIDESILLDDQESLEEYELLE